MSIYGVKLHEKCKSIGVECKLVYPDVPDMKHPKIEDCLMAMLKAAKR